MTPPRKHQQPIYLEPEKAEALDRLAAESGNQKASLLREAVDELLALNGYVTPTPKVREVRAALKLARRQLLAYRKDLSELKRGKIPLDYCQDAIDAIDRARAEFGE